MVAKVTSYKKLIESFGIKCYGGAKQVPLFKLHPGVNKQEHLEIDLIGIVGSFGLLIEVTDQKDENRKKIKKFIRHCELFLSSTASWEDRISYFSETPSDMFDSFKSAKKWKFIYFGESLELIEEKIELGNFPEAKDNLIIFNIDHIEYLKSLSNSIGFYARNEFLSSLGSEPKDFGERDSLTREFLKLENRTLSIESKIKADVYLLDFSPEELLGVGRVFRYGGVSFPFEVTKGQRRSRYQRVFIPEKLKAIATQYIKNNPGICFPNTVTLILSKECKEDTFDNKPVLLIPNRYASINIIDGQHRIFAYAHDSISSSTRKDARILASAICFKTEDEDEKDKLAARIFWTINSRQATAKTELLYLIKYDVLGEKDPKALAGEIIRQCNDTKKALGQLFKTHPLRRRNKFEESPIPITTIVQELASLLDIEKMKLEKLDLKSIEKMFGSTIAELDPEILIVDGRMLLEKYFGIVADVFNEDWKKKSGSNILCANYIAALIRLLRHLAVEKELSIEETRDELERLKNNVRKLCNTSAGKPTFSGSCSHILEKKSGVATIYNFMKSNLQAMSSS